MPVLILGNKCSNDCMGNPAFVKLVGYLKAVFRWGKLVRKTHGETNSQNEQGEVNITEPCHDGKVHIFIRGLVDDKLHVAKNRNYSDVRFYKKQNLRVFCATCRARLM